MEEMYRKYSTEDCYGRPFHRIIYTLWHGYDPLSGHRGSDVVQIFPASVVRSRGADYLSKRRRMSDRSQQSGM